MICLEVNRFKKSSTLLVLSWLIFCGQILLAQVTTATISGTARDQTNAVIPGATVIVKNVDTGITRVVITDESMRTAWAARYSGDEHQLGTIGEGKLADCVVLGGDYMSVPADQLAKLPIDLTIVGGKIVYERARDGEITSPLWDRRGSCSGE